MLSLKIYVVDDEKILRVSLADDLRDAGYEVSEFDNPLEVLNRIVMEAVDVVITDIKMPQLDGIELLSKIIYLKPDTKVIIMTAYGSIQEGSNALRRGAYDYLMKPFKINDVLLLLERISDNR